jgi:hypothetical protein
MVLTHRMTMMPAAKPSTSATEARTSTDHQYRLLKLLVRSLAARLADWAASAMLSFLSLIARRAFSAAPP